MLLIYRSEERNREKMADNARCVLKSHRLLIGREASPVPLSVRTPDGRQPMQSGDCIVLKRCNSLRKGIKLPEMTVAMIKEFLDVP